MGMVCAILVLQYPKLREVIVGFCLMVVARIGVGVAFNVLLPPFLT